MRPSRIGLVLCPTPREHLVDAQGRPYFLWDVDVTLDDFERRLRSADPEVRAYWTGKLLRQAKPDDALTFVSAEQIHEQWPLLTRYLGQQREFWAWLLDRWIGPGHGPR